ncbi:hypothetical protein TL16_g06166 [Triparma laevis f. inornata]|uniref:Uncharacterized protein n=1 Tax=Triparma laevis f. inornata TaxID=1714386 RepID=A0A9W7AJD2_9STRA|nr:hypothetical protein TL16_g06166 [Triparma laevis f. inornata]
MSSDSDSSSNCLGGMDFMFDSQQPTILQTYNFPPSIKISMNVIDDDPGAVISGHYLWPASHLMGRYLTEEEGIQIFLKTKPKNIIELGAGCGMSGLVAGQVWGDAELTFTDYDFGVLTRCESNRDETLKSASSPGLINAKFVNLEWGDSEVCAVLGKFDLILGSDVIYSAAIVTQLMKTVNDLIADDNGVFIMTQSFVYDKETEDAIEKERKAMKIEKEVVVDAWSGIGEVEVLEKYGIAGEQKGKITIFRRARIL